MVNFMGLRIGGVSGIFKSHDSAPGHFEESFSGGDGARRSVYHSRAVDARLLGAAGALDAVLSHDWPRCAARGGDVEALLRSKPFLADDVRAGVLGSPLLDPVAQGGHRLWLSAHLHVAYAAVLPGGARFLALDKPLPGRHFAQWITMPVNATDQQFHNRELQIDGRWLAVLRAGLKPQEFFGRGRCELPSLNIQTEEDPLPCGLWINGQPGLVTESILQRLGLSSLAEIRQSVAANAAAASAPSMFATKRMRSEAEEILLPTGPPPKDPNVLDISE